MADDETDTFAFATCGHHLGDPALVTEVISSEELLHFVHDEPGMLPARVRTWFELTGG